MNPVVYKVLLKCIIHFSWLPFFFVGMYFWIFACKFSTCPLVYGVLYASPQKLVSLLVPCQQTDQQEVNGWMVEWIKFLCYRCNIVFTTCSCRINITGKSPHLWFLSHPKGDQAAAENPVYCKGPVGRSFNEQSKTCISLSWFQLTGPLSGSGITFSLFIPTYGMRWAPRLSTLVFSCKIPTFVLREDDHNVCHAFRVKGANVESTTTRDLPHGQSDLCLRSASMFWFW